MAPLVFKKFEQNAICYEMSYTERRSIECLVYNKPNQYQWIASLDAKLNRKGTAIEIIDVLSRQENCGYGSALLKLLFDSIQSIEKIALSEVRIVTGGLSPFNIDHWGKLAYFYNKTAQVYPQYALSIRAKGIEFHPQDWKQAVQLCQSDNSFAYVVYEKSGPI